MSLRNALLLVVLAVLLVGIVPAGLLTSKQLETTIEDRTRDDLHRAGMVLRDRWAVTVGLRMMHAQDLARIPELGEALAAGRDAHAAALVTDAANQFDEQPMVFDASGAQVAGPPAASAEVVEATRRGEMPVTVVDVGSGPYLVALAPVKMDQEWVGAAGGATPFALLEAGTLAGLTRSFVVIVSEERGVTASTLEDVDAAPVIAAALAALPTDSVATVTTGGRTYLAIEADVQGDVHVLFVRDLDDELGVLPALQNTALVTSGIALAVALLLGLIFAARLSRPVGSLAEAADQLAAGDVDAPLTRSAIKEVGQLSDAFASMRATLVARLEELVQANAELEDRQERLAMLQAELVQRERASATGQLVAQIAHEIRNPIASVRNCLEVLRRSVDDDTEAAEFADLAIDELLRMHELAEQMLNVKRPRSDGTEACDAQAIATEVAALVDAGTRGDAPVSVVGPSLAVAMDADALKQVLFNLVLNAREASGPAGPIEIVLRDTGDGARVEVLDRGPGMTNEVLARVFDPFFTTKDEVHGVGLGLFMAEAMVRTVGGRLDANNRTDGPGARFVLDLKAATAPPSAGAAQGAAHGAAHGTAHGAAE